MKIPRWWSKSLILLTFYFSVASTLASEPSSFTDDERDQAGKDASVTMGMAAGGGLSEDTAPGPAVVPVGKPLTDVFQDEPPPSEESKVSRREEGTLNPSLWQSEDACDRDYQLPCPTSYTMITNSTGGFLCAPAANYMGSCQELVDVTSMSLQAKKHFSERCQSFWPCNPCERDFAQQCPLGWEPVTGSMTKCSQSPAYVGPCVADNQVDFNQFSASMLRKWSVQCRSYWPCLLPHQHEFPLGKAATNRRVMNDG